MIAQFISECNHLFRVNFFSRSVSLPLSFFESIYSCFYIVSFSIYLKLILASCVIESRVRFLRWTWLQWTELFNVIICMQHFFFIQTVTIRWDFHFRHTVTMPHAHDIIISFGVKCTSANATEYIFFFGRFCFFENEHSHLENVSLTGFPLSNILRSSAQDYRDQPV